MISGKFNFKKVFSYVLPFALMVVFLYVSFKNIDLNEVVDRLSDISIQWALVFSGVFLFSHWLRAWRWQYALKSVKPNASIWNLWGALMVGYGVNCVVPRLGELYRALFIGKWENLSRSSMFGTIIVERVIDVFALVLSVLLSVVIYPGDLFGEVTWLKTTVYIGFVAVFAVSILLFLIVKLKEPFYNGIVKVVGKVSEKLAVGLAGMFQTLVEGFATIKGTKNYLMIIFLSAAIMFVYGLNAYVGFFIVGLENEHVVTLSMGWVLMTIGAFGVIIPTPGGTGSYHTITMFVLIDLLAFSETGAAAYAIVTHVISYIFFISSTVLAIYLVNRLQKKKGLSKENFLSVFNINKGE